MGHGNHRREWMANILTALRKNYGRSRIPQAPLFPLLVKTILSQNTTDTNRDQSYRQLTKRFSLTSASLARADVKEIEGRIKVGGLGSIKATRLVKAAAFVENELKGQLEEVVKLPKLKARELLMKIPGVGPKTADVILAFGAEVPTVPVDTHLFTIGGRLGLSNSKRYDDVQRAYEDLIPEEERIEAHLLFIKLGKQICTARHPFCSKCPITMLCPKRGVLNSR